MSRAEISKARGNKSSIGGDGMRELVRTNNPVLISAIGALLDAAKIPHMSCSTRT